MKPRFDGRLKETRNDDFVALNGTYATKPLRVGTAPRLGNRGRGRKAHNNPDFKLTHQAEFAKTKILKIYPLMGKTKFSE